MSPRLSPISSGDLSAFSVRNFPGGGVGDGGDGDRYDKHKRDGTQPRQLYIPAAADTHKYNGQFAGDDREQRKYVQRMYEQTNTTDMEIQRNG